VTGDIMTDKNSSQNDNTWSVSRNNEQQAASKVKENDLQI
jgi:hypothetical protein